MNVSTYVFDSQQLLFALDQLTDENAQQEYYITDCPAVLLAAGKRVTAEKVLQPCESMSINNMDELALVEVSDPEHVPHETRLIHMTDLKIFSGNANPKLSKAIADYLGVGLGKIALGAFPDGETSCKIDEDIRGRDVYLIQPTSPTGQ